MGRSIAEQRSQLGQQSRQILGDRVPQLIVIDPRSRLIEQHCLVLYASTKPRLERGPRPEIGWTTEDSLQLICHANMLEESDPGVRPKLDEKVHIAIRPQLSPRRGSEQCQSPHPVPFCPFRQPLPRSSVQGVGSCRSTGSGRAEALDIGPSDAVVAARPHRAQPTLANQALDGIN
jgi:hypothetical protein